MAQRLIVGMIEKNVFPPAVSFDRITQRHPEKRRMERHDVYIHPSCGLQCARDSRIASYLAWIEP